MTITETNNGNDDKVVILLSRGVDDERATIGWTLANAGVAEGQDVTVFLVSAGVDLARRGAAATVQMNPHDPSMQELIDKFMTAGGTVWACPPCASLRGYDEADFIDGVTITGAGPLYDVLRSGATTLCF